MSEHLPFDILVDYWACDLEPTVADDVEAHLFSCAECTKAAERIAAITETLRALVPPIVTRAALDRLRARGLAIEDNYVEPDVESSVTFIQQDLVIHHLRGLALADAERVDVTVRVEETGDVLVEQTAAPFERDTGEVLVACQRHFAAFPPNVVFVVTTMPRTGPPRVARYVVHHAFAST